MIEKTSMSQPHWAQRINVVGTTGAGKTTVARRLSEILCIPHVEIDALFWGPNWGRAPAGILAQRVAEATSPDRWVVDGNYSVVRDLIWPKATGIVWLDYPFPVVFLRLLSRTARRVFFKEDLWNGNRERIHAQFMSRDSLFLGALRTHRRRRKQSRRASATTGVCSPGSGTPPFRQTDQAVVAGLRRGFPIK